MADNTKPNFLELSDELHDAVIGVIDLYLKRRECKGVFGTRAEDPDEFCNELAAFIWSEMGVEK